MKTVKVSLEIWKRLSIMAIEQETTIGKVIEGLLDGK